MLLADEPTSALDHANKESFLRLLNEVLDDTNCAMVFVSHDPSIGEMFEDRVALDDLNQSGVRTMAPGALFGVAYQSLRYRIGGVVLARRRCHQRLRAAQRRARAA